MSKITIRDAKQEDAKRILDIYAYYVRNTAISFEYDVPILSEFQNRIKNTMKRFPYLVIERNGIIQGYAYASPFHERAAYGWSCETTIYLDHTAQKRGLGRKIYEALEDRLQKMGMLNLYACIGYPETEDAYLNRNSADFHGKADWTTPYSTEWRIIMKSTPVKGTRDYLPKEAEIRDYLQNVILETYRDAGFEKISTPIIEDAENLDKSEGGENLNLIFRILKRGQKLEAALNREKATETELSDMGLRYDLTLPLSRYFANHRNDLTMPFKVIQMDRVYRAERPQKGRLREFMQCDIDIIGNASQDAEVELILTTTKALNRVGIKKYKVKINDRRILKSIFAYAGFAETEHEKLAIIFDKLDKIGIDGVREELTSCGYDSNAVEKFINLFENGALTLDSVAQVCDAAYVSALKQIIDTVTTVSGGSIPIEFSPSLVRGQGYYTGTIFEVEAEGYSGAVAGGGRYDNLIGKFLKEDIPAVGFSIGFERIFGILMEEAYAIPGRKQKIAVFYDPDTYADALSCAEKLRESYSVSVIARPKKLGKYLNKLETQGFDGFAVYGQQDGVKLF